MNRVNARALGELVGRIGCVAFILAIVSAILSLIL